MRTSTPSRFWVKLLQLDSQWKVSSGPDRSLGFLVSSISKHRSDFAFVNTNLGIRLKFISPIKDQTVKEGETARFELELSHENIPVTWYKNDVKIHPSRTVLTLEDGKKHVLEIKDVTLDDTCQIKAEAKGMSTMANLMVIGKY